MVDGIHSNGMSLPSPDGARPTEAGRDVEALRTNERARPPEVGGPPPSDRVEISDAAVRLVDQTSAAADSRLDTRTLSPERLAQVTRRLNEGFFDTEAVRGEIAQRVLPDLRTQTAE